MMHLKGNLRQFMSDKVMNISRYYQDQIQYPILTFHWLEFKSITETSIWADP